jgi:hypothetical protein
LEIVYKGDDTENFYFLSNDVLFEQLDDQINYLKKNKVFAGDQLSNEYFIDSYDKLSSHLVDIVMVF